MPIEAGRPRSAAFTIIYVEHPMCRSEHQGCWVAVLFRSDHAAYLASWVTVLKADKRAIFTGAALAQKAVHWFIAKPGNT
jgi:antirestriction protein ArdC